MSKVELRKSLKEQRQKLSAEQRAEHSQRIINRAFEVIPWDRILSIHCYLPIESQKEVDSLPFLKAAYQQNNEVKIATAWRADSEVKTNWLNKDFQIDKPVKPGFHFGLVVVPMLAFDSRGYRLGYGGGFYDQFLPTQPDALKIGLCYELGHQKTDLPHEDHDVPLDLIATEDFVYRF